MIKKFSIIVAISENNGIGKDNRLLFHIPDDLKRFKKLTKEHTVIMGKKTFESLPVKPLPERRNIVITDIPGEIFTGCISAYSIQDVFALADENKENFIIGGGMVYKQFLPYTDKLYITQLHHIFEADTFFPGINYSEWKLMERQDINKSQNIPFDYSFLFYKRIIP
ncbi:MAG: dihydrofolate reductase [Bacteroidia bacterium]|nr:dihydrofolate reductase [Bacteroidia bacterium]